MIKTLLSLIFVAFLVGDCVKITTGILKGSHWKIIEITGNTYILYDDEWTVTKVPGKFLVKTRKCKGD